MVMRVESVVVASKLPDNLRTLFWDCDFASLDLSQYRNFVIRRILDRGNWDAIMWLRHTLGDMAIKEWFITKHGRGLDARKIRFWEVILDMPKADVDEWVRRERTSNWHGRRS